MFIMNKANGGKICLLWNSGVSVSWLASSNQFVIVKVEENGLVFVLTIVYAKCSMLERESLLHNLEDIAVGNLPWVLCGDFNIIKDDSKEEVGILVYLLQCSTLICVLQTATCRK